MSTGLVRIHLQPLGEAFDAPRGAPLRDVLFGYGVEFPCGGRGRCKRCRVRVLEGALAISPEETGLLSPEELRDGWRLACHARADAPVTLEIAQWDAAILADDSAFDFTPGEGLAVAVDLGTTTLVAQLLDLRTGRVLAVRAALNPQAVLRQRRHEPGPVRARGAGSSLAHGSHSRPHRRLVAELTAAAKPGGAAIRDIAIVGNAVMHHLFCGIDVEPLSHVPFEPLRDGLELFRASALGWQVAGDPPVRFLPCLGGFVGSDILAGILATKMHQSDALVGLIDLGTNGEIVFGNRERMICASTAAGPAFEGGAHFDGHARLHRRHHRGDARGGPPAVPRAGRCRAARHLRQRAGRCGGRRFGSGRHPVQRPFGLRAVLVPALPARGPDPGRHPRASACQGRLRGRHPHPARAARRGASGGRAAVSRGGFRQLRQACQRPPHRPASISPTRSSTRPATPPCWEPSWRCSLPPWTSPRSAPASNTSPSPHTRGSRRFTSRRWGSLPGSATATHLRSPHHEASHAQENTGEADRPSGTLRPGEGRHEPDEGTHRAARGSITGQCA